MVYHSSLFSIDLPIGPTIGVDQHEFADVHCLNTADVDPATSTWGGDTAPGGVEECCGQRLNDIARVPLLPGRRASTT